MNRPFPNTVAQFPLSSHGSPRPSPNTVRVQHQTQADRIFNKFGGVPALSKALARVGENATRSLSALYRWNLPRLKGGSGGVVPSAAWPDILRAARLDGIVLTPEDCFPLKQEN